MTHEKGTAIRFFSTKKTIWLIICCLIILTFMVLPKMIFKTDGYKGTTTTPAIAQDAVDVLITKENPLGYQQVREDCLSGLIQVPLNSRLMVYAPGWAEYWFYTEDGYKVFRVKDHEVEIKKTILPSCSFRIRGKFGKAIIQLET